MKKLILLFIIIFQCSFIMAQTDTIEITQFKSTQLIFNDEVTYVEAGTGDLQVKNKIVDNLLIIQSIVPESDFIETNLFIKTKSNIYNPIIKYSANPKRSTLLEQNLKNAIAFAQNKNRVETKQPNTSSSVPSKILQSVIGIANTSNEQIIVSTISNASDVFKPSRQYTTGVWFKFLAHYIENNKFYFKFSLENSSDLDYNTDHFFFSIKNKKKRNATETQKEVNYSKLLTPIDVISARTTKILIFEFDSFSINKDEEFIVELKEKNGARNFIVGIPYYIINRPLKLKN